MSVILSFSSSGPYTAQAIAADSDETNSTFQISLINEVSAYISMKGMQCDDAAWQICWAVRFSHPAGAYHVCFSFQERKKPGCITDSETAQAKLNYLVGSFHRCINYFSTIKGTLNCCVVISYYYSVTSVRVGLSGPGRAARPFSLD